MTTNPKTSPTTGEIVVEVWKDAWMVFVPIDPVPASRPRVSRWSGVYYGKRYSNFRKLVGDALSCVDLPKEFPLEGPLHVDVEFRVLKPKSSKREFPRGDVDNYFKTLDSFTGVVWVDDDQIVSSAMKKVYSEHPGIMLHVRGIE